ncbi:hypothetical protein AMTRI_Chr13g83310 [Amborella trichopoda]
MIWEERNRRMFQGRTLTREKLTRRITCHVCDLADAKVWTYHISEKAITENLRLTWRQQRIKLPITVAWAFLHSQHFKLNIDGSSIQNPGQAGCGGVLRHDNGSFVAAFSVPLGMASYNYVEFRGLQEGVDLATQMECFPLQIESDCSLLVQVILGRYKAPWALNTIIANCKSRLENHS